MPLLVRLPVPSMELEPSLAIGNVLRRNVAPASTVVPPE